MVFKSTKANKASICTNSLGIWYRLYGVVPGNRNLPESR